MKKIILFLLSIVILISAASCNRVTEKTKVQLVNKMTDTELNRVDKHALTLLGEPEIMESVEAFNAQEHTVQIEKGNKTKDDLYMELQDLRDTMAEEQYREIEEKYASLPADFSAPMFIIWWTGITCLMQSLLMSIFLKEMLYNSYYLT